MSMNEWLCGGVRNTVRVDDDGRRISPGKCIELAESRSSVEKQSTGLCIECARKKVIGKPYEGEPHVRFDEGELVVKSLKYSITWNQ